MLLSLIGVPATIVGFGGLVRPSLVAGMLNIHTPLTLFFFGLAICFVTSGIYHEGKTVCLWHARVQTMNDVFFALFVAQNIYVTEKLFQQEVSPTLDQAFRATFVMFLLPMALVILNANQLILYTCV